MEAMPNSPPNHLALSGRHLSSFLPEHDDHGLFLFVIFIFQLTELFFSSSFFLSLLSVFSLFLFPPAACCPGS